MSGVYSKSALHSSPALASQSKSILFDRLLPIVARSTDQRQCPNGIEVYSLFRAQAMDSLTAYMFGLANSSNFLSNEKYREHWLGMYGRRKPYIFYFLEVPRLSHILESFYIELIPGWVYDITFEIEDWCMDICKATMSSEKARNIDKSGYADPGDEPVVFKAVSAGIQKEVHRNGADSVLATTLKDPEMALAAEMLDQLAAGRKNLTLPIQVHYF